MSSKHLFSAYLPNTIAALGGLALTASMLTTSASAIAQKRTKRTMIVLDASGSMWAQVNGISRVEIARETLRDVLSEMPAERELGLVACGHREKGNFDDIETLFEPAEGMAEEIVDTANRLNTLGKTPLSAAVKMVSEAMNYVEDKATAVLITDGLEICDADPYALTRELENRGVNLTSHVVGFGLSDEDSHQIACLVEYTAVSTYPPTMPKS